MRIVCPGCGGEVVGGFERPSELSWCGSKCAREHGQPDRIVAALRELEAAAPPAPSPRGEQAAKPESPG